MSWRILYIEENDHLSLYLDNVRIKKVNREVTIPLSDINTVMIDNQQTTLSASLINKCAEYNVSVITCDHKHLPQAIILPSSGHYRAAAIFREQLRWPEDTLTKLWQKIVQRKIINQANILQGAHKSMAVRDRLYKFATETQLADAGNCEGLAAKMYFRELFGADFSRDAESSVNAALNYGYSIFRSQIARALVAHGLNPHIGIFHRGPNNAFNLSDDIIEPFRPIVDRFAYETIIPGTIFSREHRLALIALPTKKVVFDGKRITLIFAITNTVQSLIASAESGDCGLLNFPDITTIYDL
jgi:CRISPR-associated protein Cas1